MDYLEKLNEQQQKAVLAIDGKIKVVAGAGSGKTRVIAHRYAYLVNEIGIDPANILCMTFTNKAAQEMKSRIGQFVHRGNINDFVCTIHGFCVKFLRREIYRIGYPKTFSIIDEEDCKELAKIVLNEYGLDRQKSTIKNFLSDVRQWKKGGGYIGKYLLAETTLTPEDITPFVRYILLQQKSYGLDFSDIINMTIYILQEYEDARKYWQDVINYVMVDEVQDCNPDDWLIINTISEKYDNLFIVGDPDQAIYEWRGSAPKYFVEYEADQEIILNMNYRSTPDILNVANSIIKHNKNRIKKDLITTKEPDCLALHYHAVTEKKEAQWIAAQIEKLVESGNAYSDIAILYRASYLSRYIEEALIDKRIQYTVWGGVRFFERKEIKDLLAYLRLIVYNDDLSLSRIVNVPSRRFGPSSFDKLNNYAKEENSLLFDSLVRHKTEFDNQAIYDFIELIEQCRSLKDTFIISELSNYVLTRSGLKDMYRKDGDEERLENITELMNSIKYYEEVNAEEPDVSIETYLQDIALYTNADYKKDGPTVKLMTIHQAKGLEFPYVFVCGLSEGIFPNHRAIRSRGMEGEEEERRLMYVAVTRAEKALFLTDSEGFNHNTGSKYPSRFLLEIKKNLIKVEGTIDPSLLKGTKQLIKDARNNDTIEDPNGFQVGDQVEHRVFGKGVIIDINERTKACKVIFDNDEKKIKYLNPSVIKTVLQNTDNEPRQIEHDIFGFPIKKNSNENHKKE